MSDRGVKYHKQFIGFCELFSLLARRLPASALPQNYSGPQLFGKGKCLFPDCNNSSDEYCHGDFWAPCLVQWYNGIQKRESMPFFRPDKLAELTALYLDQPEHPGWSYPSAWSEEEIRKYELGFQVPDGYLQPGYPIGHFLRGLHSESIVFILENKLRTNLMQRTHRNYEKPLAEYYSLEQICDMVVLAKKFFDWVIAQSKSNDPVKNE